MHLIYTVISTVHTCMYKWWSGINHYWNRNERQFYRGRGISAFPVPLKFECVCIFACLYTTSYTSTTYDTRTHTHTQSLTWQCRTWRDSAWHYIQTKDRQEVQHMKRNENTSFHRYILCYVTRHQEVDCYESFIRSVFGSQARQCLMRIQVLQSLKFAGKSFCKSSFQVGTDLKKRTDLHVNKAEMKERKKTTLYLLCIFFATVR